MDLRSQYKTWNSEPIREIIWDKEQSEDFPNNSYVTQEIMTTPGRGPCEIKNIPAQKRKLLIN